MDAINVKQYLQTIQDKDVQRRALKNLQIERAGDTAKSLEHAIFTAFLWHKTPERFDYWKAIHHNVKYPADLMQVPKIK